jgi:hypothetical protein
MLQCYNESRLKSSFCEFYGCYDDFVCDCKLSLAQFAEWFLQTRCWSVLPYWLWQRVIPYTSFLLMLTPLRHLIVLSHLKGSVLPYTRLYLLIKIRIGVTVSVIVFLKNIDMNRISIHWSSPTGPTPINFRIYNLEWICCNVFAWTNKIFYSRKYQPIWW